MGGGGSKKQTVGYEYYLGLHMILCHGPIDAVTKLTIADRVAWTGVNTGGAAVVSAPNLFGGKDREGGVSGNLEIDMGGSSQPQNAYLRSRCGAQVPYYRGVVGVILRGFTLAEAITGTRFSIGSHGGFYIGNNPYLKKFAFRARRNTKRTDGRVPIVGVSMTIGDDMNPASIIHECLTDNNWGMGYSYSDMDEGSFVSVGATLSAESMGISLMWDSQIPLESFIKEILKHIDGVLYVDVRTGLFTLKLIRDDYVFANLPVLDESNITVVKDYNKPVVGELINSVTVKYWDVTTGSDASLTVQDIALQLTQQETISTTVQYPGFTNGQTVARAASRDLFAFSTPLITCSVFGTRELANLALGDAFRLQWPDLEINDVVMRVVGVEFGSQGSSKVKISATQDAFAAGDPLVASPPETEWVEYRSEPADPLFPFMTEMTYWDMVMLGGQTTADAMGELDTAFLVAATKPSPDSLFMSLYINGVAGYEQATDITFSGTAQLHADIGYLDTVFDYDNGLEVFSGALQNYIQIGEELMNLVDLTDTTITVERGVLDTIPAQHTVGTRIYFNGGGGGSDGVTYQFGETASVKLLTATPLGVLDEPSAPVFSKTLNKQRQFRPYPPAYVQINSTLYPTSILNTVDIAVTWKSRSRLHLTSAQLYPWTNPNSFGEEVGQTYTVQLCQTSGTLITEQTGLTVLTATFLLATFSAYSTIRVKVWSVRDGYSSLQVFDYQFDRVA